MRGRALLFTSFLLLSTAAHAQIWQPAAAPPVTAENTGWFQSGEPIYWMGDVYYPAGATRMFDSYVMVRSSSYRGIPLYVDSTLEPYSVVFVPLAGNRMQPYERRRVGVLAGTIGSQAPSLPTATATEAALPAIAQAAMPPTFAGAYEMVTTADGIRVPVSMGSIGVPAAGFEAAPPVAVAPETVAANAESPIRTSIRDLSEPLAVGTSGRFMGPLPLVTTVIPPSGVDGIWVNFDGTRWYAGGKAIDYDAAILEEIGTYHGWTVYRRKGDPSVIYIPSAPGRLAGYARRK
jgi:hypothetical protein